MVAVLLFHELVKLLGFPNLSYSSGDLTPFILTTKSILPSLITVIVLQAHSITIWNVFSRINGEEFFDAYLPQIVTLNVEHGC